MSRSASGTAGFTRPYVVVANRRAGAGRAHGLIREVEAALGSAPFDVIEPDLTSAFPQRLNDAISGANALERPSASDRPLLVCIGGDGTLSLAFDALSDPAAVTLALVPCGSGNDLARTLGIGTRRDALDVLYKRIERQIDYGTVNGQRFLNCVGIGLDAEVANLAARIRARGLAKGFSYHLAALRGLLSVKPVRATVRTSEVELRYEDLVMITAGNGAWYGGGFRGAPQAQIDDGALDCYAFRDVAGLMPRLGLMQRIRAGAHPADQNVATLRTRRLEVEFERPVAMHVDGELTHTQRAELAVVPLGARILAPAPASE